MAWKTVAEGKNFSDLHSTGVIGELPHGTKFKIIIDTPWYAPVAPLFDIAGAEWIADRFLNEAGAKLLDVEGEGLNRIIMHFEADPVWLTPAGLAAIAAILIAIGLIVVAVRIDADLLAPLAAGAIVAIILGLIVAIWVYTRRGGT